MDCLVRTKENLDRIEEFIVELKQEKVMLVATSITLPDGFAIKAQAATVASPRIVSSSGTYKLPGLNDTIDYDTVTTWDCIWFGSYWQKDTNGDGKANQSDAKTPVKWRVLSF